jgi:hypothetical protein
MLSAADKAITHRFLGFVNEVIGFRPISRTLRVLIVRPVSSDARTGSESAAVFFATEARGVAIASWATTLARGATEPNSLLRALEGSGRKLRQVTAPGEIHSALTALSSALEARLQDKPKSAVVLTASFTGAAFDLATLAASSAGMPLIGNSSLADYLATFPAAREKAG